MHARGTAASGPPRPEAQAGRERELLWALSSPPAVAAIRFGAKLLVAWSVSIADFGVLALAGALSYAAAHLSCLGFDAALVHARVLDAPLLRALERRLLAAGLAVSALQALCGALLFAAGEERLGALLAACAPLALLSNFGVVPEARLLRERAFAASFRVDTARALAFATSAALLAALGAGPWSMVAGWWAQGCVSLAMVRRCARRLAAPPEAGGDGLGATAAYGRDLLGASLARFGAERADLLGVAMLLGRAAAGLYEIALQLAHFLVELAASLAERCLFPILAQARREESLDGALAAAWRVQLVYFLPASLVLAAAAPELTALALPERWSAAAPVVRLAFLGAAARGLWLVPQAALKAMGRSRVVLAGDLALLGALVLVLALLAPRGLEALVGGWLAVRLCGALVLWGLAAHSPSTPLAALLAGRATGFLLAWALCQLAAGAWLPLPAGAGALLVARLAWAAATWTLLRLALDRGGLAGDLRALRPRAAAPLPLAPSARTQARR